MDMRSLSAAVSAFRSRLANIASVTFGGRRDLYRAFGYKRELVVSDYRSRFDRNEVANRIVKALPYATWRGGADIVEDEDPEVITAFEQAFIDLDKRIKIWDKVKRADVLAGIGRYAILLIGAPGDLNTPLVTCSFDDLVYLQPFAEEDATIEKFDSETASPRFGLPEYYTVKRTSMTGGGSITAINVGRRVHWSRVIHVSDGLLDDNVYGEPRLKGIWNRIDDLEKVVGGGAEAFFRRADQGTMFDLDPELEFTPEQQTALKNQINEFENGFKRTIFSRGLDMKTMGSDVADFKAPVEAILSLISTGCGIPMRVLMGSEQGKLAAKQDRANWDNRVTDRQNDYADPCIARVLVDRLIALGAVPPPVNGEGAYEIHFSSIATMDDEQRASMATQWATLNQTTGKTIVTVDEIRTLVLELPPLGDVDEGAAQQNDEPPAPKPSGFGRTAAAKKGGASWKKVHQAADRFRQASKAGRLRQLRSRPNRDRSLSPAEGAEE